MSKEMEFFIFLLEQYAKAKHMTADKVLMQWDELHLTNRIYNMYERYHSEAIENAVYDIDQLISHACESSL